MTVLARGELLVATNGTIARRDNGLVPLLLAERGVHVMSGRKRLNPYLTTEQRELLESLPPIRCDVDTILACEAAIARVFIARGRALAHQVGAPWPAAFEQATVAHVQAALGVSLMH